MNAGKLAMMACAAVRRYPAAMTSHLPNERRGITWFVSRHPGAIAWAKRERLVIDRWVEHLDPALTEAGDIVIGTLPVNLAAEVCNRGARYLHLSLKIPAQWRGKELSMDDLQQIAAHIAPYHIQQMAPDFFKERT